MTCEACLCFVSWKTPSEAPAQSTRVYDWLEDCFRNDDVSDDELDTLGGYVSSSRPERSAYECVSRESTTSGNIVSGEAGAKDGKEEQRTEGQDEESSSKDGKEEQRTEGQDEESSSKDGKEEQRTEGQDEESSSKDGKEEQRTEGQDEESSSPRPSHALVVGEIGETWGQSNVSDQSAEFTTPHDQSAEFTMPHDPRPRHALETRPSFEMPRRKRQRSIVYLS